MLVRWKWVGLCIIDIVGTVTVILLRRVAQFGRALRSGRRGRKFESCRDDFLAGAPEYLNFQEFRYFLLYSSAHLPMVWRPISNIVFRCCVIPWNKIHFFCPAFCAFWKRTNIFNFLFPLANLLLKPYNHFPISYFFVYLPKHIFIRLLPILFKVNLHLFSITKSLIFLLNLIKSY